MKPITETALYSTIMAQPGHIARLIQNATPAEEAAARLQQARRVYLLGIGTSYHAAQVGSYLLRDAGADAWAMHSFDFASYPRPIDPADAFIVISHRGTKRYSIQARERIAAAGAFCLAISGLAAPAQGASLQIETVPNEVSAAHTASYTSALTVLATIAAAMGAEAIRSALPRLPALVTSVLEAAPQVRDFAGSVAKDARISIVGAGPNEPTATEGALKLKEASYVTAEGMGMEQFLHGPLVAVGSGDLLIAIDVPGPSGLRAGELLGVATGVGARTTWIGEPSAAATGSGFPIPAVTELPESLTPLLTVLPLQLFACYMAEARGVNPDSFRRDHAEYDKALAPIQL